MTAASVGAMPGVLVDGSSSDCELPQPYRVPSSPSMPLPWLPRRAIGLVLGAATLAVCLWVSVMSLQGSLEPGPAPSAPRAVLGTLGAADLGGLLDDYGSIDPSLGRIASNSEEFSDKEVEEGLDDLLEEGAGEHDRGDGVEALEPGASLDTLTESLQQKFGLADWDGNQKEDGSEGAAQGHPKFGPGMAKGHWKHGEPGWKQGGPGWKHGGPGWKHGKPQWAGHHPGPMWMKKVWILFKEADKDHNKVLEGAELDVVARELQKRFNLTGDRYKTLFSQIGATADGKLDFQALRQFVGTLSFLMAADKNHNGLLEAGELNYIAYSLAPRLQRLGVQPERYEEIFEESDANADGKLDPKELKHLLIEVWSYFVPPPMAKFFRRADRNQDGVLEGAELDPVKTMLQKRFQISEQEFDTVFKREVPSGKVDLPSYKRLAVALHKASPFAKVKPWMMHFFLVNDKNHDGHLDRTELDSLGKVLGKKFWTSPNDLQDQITKVDRDSDGKLEPDEFQQLILAAKNASPFKGLCPRMVGLFKVADKNKDHFLDSDEELQIVAARFERIFQATVADLRSIFLAADKNSDNKLSPEEFREAVKALRARGKHPRQAVQVRASAQRVPRKSSEFTVQY